MKTRSPNCAPVTQRARTVVFVVVTLLLFSRQAHAVIVPFMGPLQALIAVLPQLIMGLFALFLLVFKRTTYVRLGRFFWHHKVFSVVLIFIIGGSIAWFSLTGGAQVGVQETGQAWLGFRGGSARTGHEPGSLWPNSSTLNWSFLDKGFGLQDFYASPAVMGNRVYTGAAQMKVTGGSGRFYCLDADTGAVVWSKKGFKPFFSSPAVTEDMVITGEGFHYDPDCRVLAFDVNTGELKWSYQTKSHVESSPFVAEGRVFIGAGDDGLYCFNLADGEVLWHLAGEDYPDIESSPAVFDGRVYFGCGLHDELKGNKRGQRVVCVSAEGGTPIWEKETPYPVFGAPTIYAGKVYVGMGNGDFVNKDPQPAGVVMCLDAETGKEIWQAKTNDNVLAAVAIAGGRAYFASRSGDFWCVSAETGEVIYTWDAGADILASPAASEEGVLVSTAAGKLVALDPDRAEVKWSVTLAPNAPNTSSPAVAGGRIYVGSLTKGFFCLGQPGRIKEKPPLWAGLMGNSRRNGCADEGGLPGQGEEAWQFKLDEFTDAAILAPPAVVKESVFVGVSHAEGGALVHLHAKTGEMLWQVPTAKAIEISPAADGERVYFVEGKRGQAGRQIICLAQQTREQLWQRALDKDASAEFVLSYPDKLVLLDMPGQVRGLTRAGRELWTAAVGEVVGAPLAEHGLVLLSIGGSKPHLLCLDDESGVELWRRQLSAVPVTPLTLSELDLFVVADQGDVTELQCYDVRNGELRWSEALPEEATSPVVAGRDYLALTTISGSTMVLSRADQKMVQTLGPIEDAVAPILFRGTLVRGGEGTLDAVNLGVSGEGSTKTLWYYRKYKIMGRLTTGMAAGAGYIFAATESRGLVAIGERIRVAMTND